MTPEDIARARELYRLNEAGVSYLMATDVPNVELMLWRVVYPHIPTFLDVAEELERLRAAARALVAGAKDGVREESLLGLIADVEMALREEAQP